MRVQTTLRLPKEIYEKLKVLAASKHLSLNSYMTQLIISQKVNDDKQRMVS